MAKDGDIRIDLRGDGRVILYKRDNLKDPVWQVRVRVPNSTGYKRITTKTSDQREAERFALNYYEELYIHVKTGGSIKSKTFKQVFAEWEKHVATMGHTRKGGSWEATIERIRVYALTFFGPMRMNDIGPVQFADYWEWRKKNYNRTKPTNGTLRREGPNARSGPPCPAPSNVQRPSFGRPRASGHSLPGAISIPRAHRASSASSSASIPPGSQPQGWTNDQAPHPPAGGRELIGMPAGIKSEWWPA